MGSRAGATVPAHVVGSPTLVDCPTTTDRLCVAPMTVKPVRCHSVSAASQSGSDDDLADSELGPPDTRGPRSTLGSSPDNSVTMIMPSIGLIRSGPGVISDDSWDDTRSPLLTRPAGRARRMRLPSRVLVATVVILMGLGAVLTMPFALQSRSDATPNAALRQLPAVPDESHPAVPNSTDARSAAPLPIGESATPAATPRSTGAPAANQTNEDGQSLAQTQQATNGATVAFETLVVEAENGVLAGARSMSWPNASGGRIVRDIGSWDDDDPPGTLTLTGIVFPYQANYTITVHYVHRLPLANADAVVNVAGASGGWVGFAFNPTCCRTAALTINIPSGTRSITIENSTGRVAWIDKIVITEA